MTHANLDMPVPPIGGPLGQRELVAILAFCLAVNALAIDTMLPALNEITAHYHMPDGNAQQWVIFSYILGFGVPQLIIGPLSDRYGRKIILRVSLMFYTLLSFACMYMPSFYMLLGARFLQGIFASGIRVSATSIVRDLYAGRKMASIMSLIMTVFMIVPIIAPGIGEITLMIADWRWTFGILGLSGLSLLIWTELRLPETLAAHNQRPLKPSVVLAGYKQILTTPVSVGYILASGLLFGALFAFIGASEQIFSDVFNQEEYFALWFAGIAAVLTIANFINSKIVEHIGMRRIAHAGLIMFIFLSALNLILCYVFGPKLIYFFPLFALTFGCFGTVGANFSALAMEPLGKLAGTGSAARGFAISTLSSLIGLTVAGQYNGTLTPILIGYIFIGLITLLVVLITEKGRLFQLGSPQR